jgi:hypothetical protein
VPAVTATLPRAGRRRRPPLLRLLAVGSYVLCLGWVAVCVDAVEHGVAVACAALLVWIWLAVRAQRISARPLAADGGAVRRLAALLALGFLVLGLTLVAL